MTWSADDNEVGYRKPPRRTQFQPGQSGNPSGRKPRDQKVEASLPRYRPTQKLLRSEAERLIKVRDGERQYQIPVTQGVIRALAQGAIKGGVLAQRTYLALQQAEDLRLAQELEETFTFWENYVADARAAFATAELHGMPIPDMLPHPDDIRLDHEMQRVSIVGPCNELEAQDCNKRRALADLFYELMIYCEEARNGMPTDEWPVFGGFTLLFTTMVTGVPPRFRGMDDTLNNEIFHRATGPRRDWDRYLAERCQELGLPIEPKRLRTRFIDLRDLNLRFVEGQLVEHRWPKKRIAKR